MRHYNINSFRRPYFLYFWQGSASFLFAGKYNNYNRELYTYFMRAKGEGCRLSPIPVHRIACRVAVLSTTRWFVIPPIYSPFVLSPRPRLGVFKGFFGRAKLFFPSNNLRFGFQSCPDGSDACGRATASGDNLTETRSCFFSIWHFRKTPRGFGLWRCSHWCKRFHGLSCQPLHQLTGWVLVNHL